MTDELRIFIAQHADDDVKRLALQYKSYPHISREDMIFALQQIEGRQKAKHKIPSFYHNTDILYPQRLSMEQCSSEQTARYKADIFKSICQPYHSFADLTGGFGIDTYFISTLFEQSHYVERNSDLCKIAEHNFNILNSNITPHNTSTSDFLTQTEPLDAIFIDPARRDTRGTKVVRLQDCEPNIVDLWKSIQQKSRFQMVKMSPMIDLSQVINLLQPMAIHVVAVEGECKEIISVSQSGYEISNDVIAIKAINLQTDNDQQFIFTLQEEQSARPHYATYLQHYIYEPNAAIMKAGAYRSIANHFNIAKLAANTHLYTSDTLINDFQGRIFEVMSADIKLLVGCRANILTRNYPLSAPQLQSQLAKKYHIKDGGTDYIIGTTIGNQHILIHALRLQ